MDSIYIRWLFLLLKKFMLGSRTKIILLTSFFTFAFAISFLALLQNYAQASTSSLDSSSFSTVYTADIRSPIDHTIVPYFWLEPQVLSFDLDSDISFQKYLHTDHPFADTSYVPNDLVPINSNFTANTSKAFKLRYEAAIQFADMAWHFWNTFSGDRLYIISAYRSKWHQSYLINQWCSLIKCAKAGTSEHQAWLAVDLKVITRWGRTYSLDSAYPNVYYDWLKANAATFGFHNTYQKGVEVDGKIVEWWHRRYLGIELATLLIENNQTLAEYYNTIKN